ncbi:hypothetical protein BB934_00110 [Microvirga ossetica]|uniref:Uncharacterized protein n=1 Tax=Microvirga ossetica TaxID=1882682 RepID=A0A1B2EA17_9HYPH|nr:hypothetical protein [Microvirga ossetica]ANY76818.1 hypothetical protein BB934_00110 [Microvirga ossetica]
MTAMSDPASRPFDGPYDGRAPLDPDLLLIAATGLVPLAFVAHRLGIDHSELLARHGLLLLEERDRIHSRCLVNVIDNPRADPVTFLALTGQDWAMSGREPMRRGSRAWSASTLLQRLLGKKPGKAGKKGVPHPGTRMTATGTVLRSVPREGAMVGAMSRGGTLPDRSPLRPWSLAEIDACALLLQVTAAEWGDVIRLSERDPCAECGEDLRAFVRERLLERLLATFHGHKSPRMRLLAGRLWLMHQGPLAQGQDEAP